MRLRARVYRAHHPRWAFQPISGEGASLHGGRFNPKGMPALYTSLRAETAWIEAQQGFALKAAQPVTICAYEVDCDPVLDLTDPIVREQSGVTASEMACAWELLRSGGGDPPSWALSRRLKAEGIAGILVPSFAPGAGSSDVNAVFWTWGDALPHRVQVIDDAERLPRDDSSWR